VPFASELDAVSDVLHRNWLFSSDSHIVEPPDLWEGRVPDHLKDRAPYVRQGPGGDYWYLDDHMLGSFVGAHVGQRFKKSSNEMNTVSRFDEIPLAAYTPSRYLSENEQDGVWGTVIYPTTGLVLFNMPETEVLSVLMKGYNDWLADFCSEDPSRLKGVAMINIDDVADGVAELERARAIGLAGAMITCAPPSWQPYHSDVYDPFWAAAQDLDMPLSMHCATERCDPRIGWAAYDLPEKGADPTWMLNRDVTVRAALANLIFTGVFERFPRLTVGSIENELGWIPFFLDQLDYQYTQRANRFGDRFRIRDSSAIPSQFWHSNCFASFQEDVNGIRMRDIVGVENLVWGSDYPHVESTFPRSREILSNVFADVPAEEVRMITSTNSMRLYAFEAPLSPPIQHVAT
jgi:predicted TIM-barrel fold metal-dependent hydrolase